MADFAKFKQFDKEAREYFNELRERGCSEAYLESIFFGYYETNLNNALGINNYEVTVINPEIQEVIDMTKEQFQNYVDVLGLDAYSHVIALGYDYRRKAPR